MIHKPGTVIGKPAGNDNRNLPHAPLELDPHHRPACRLCPDPSHLVDRNDAIALDLETHRPRHVTGCSGGRFLSDEQLDLVEPARQLDPRRRDLELFGGIDVIARHCAHDDPDQDHPHSGSRKTRHCHS